MRPWHRDVAAVALGLVALAGAAWTLERAREKTDPRRAAVRAIRREAGPTDLVLVTDEAPELVALASPVPAVWGPVDAADLRGVRRVYGVAPSAAGLAPLLGRFGPGEPVGTGGFAMRWEAAERHVAHVLFDATHEIGARVTAERVGGHDNGPCPLQGAMLGCHGDEWNRVRAEAHRFDGAEMRCVYAHPQSDGRLVVHLANLPGGRAIVGAVGIDDAGYFPGGATVRAHFVVRALDQTEVLRDVDAVSRRGVAPYRIDLTKPPVDATVTVTTPNAGARQFCFTFQLVE